MTDRISLDTLAPAPGSHRNRKRLGRGPGSGKGKTSGKGHKGIKARAGHHGPGGGKPHFEGGQMPMTRRIPKRGMGGSTGPAAQLVRLDALVALADGAEITAESLEAAGIVRRGRVAKILANGEIAPAVVLRGVAVSAAAREKIVAAGGRVDE
jgi:large subunit ribosomal protein L15